MDTRKTGVHVSLLEPRRSLTLERAVAIATDAYVYGYPLVLMDVTRSLAGAPANRFVHRREFPDATYTDVVSPNADTLYSTAWLDLSREPVVLSVPAVSERHYLMPLLDAWTNVFASPGTRTTGRGPGHFAIAGPRWNGRLPAEVDKVAAPTPMVWLIGRTQTNGKADYAAVHAIQDQYRLTPLSGFFAARRNTSPESAPSAARTEPAMPPSEQVARMDAAAFFSRLNALMVKNPPALSDAVAVRSFAAVGVAPGRPLDFERLSPTVAKALAQGVRAGQAAIRAEAKKPHGRRINGWELVTNMGRYGADYLWRAAVALVGLGANLPEDALYPHARVDAEGWPLSGANRYVVRFPAGKLPPADAFWSLTLYDARQAFVDNPLGRYAIGDRDELRFASDGSLTLYLQRDSPGAAREPNWLPAPAGSFSVVLRLYWPRQEVAEGRWRMPPVERVS